MKGQCDKDTEQCKSQNRALREAFDWSHNLSNPFERWHWRSASHDVDRAAQAAL